jgi:hypothetical protein
MKEMEKMQVDHDPMPEDEIVEAETMCRSFVDDFGAIDPDKVHAFMNAAIAGWPRALAEVRRLQQERISLENQLATAQATTAVKNLKAVAANRMLTLPNGTVVRVGDVLTSIKCEDGPILVTGVGEERVLFRRLGPQHEKICTGEHAIGGSDLYRAEHWDDVYPGRPVPGKEDDAI